MKLSNPHLFSLTFWLDMSWCIRDSSVEKSNWTWRVIHGFYLLISGSFQSMYLRKIIHTKGKVYLQRQTSSYPASSPAEATGLEMIQNSLTKVFFLIIKTWPSLRTVAEQKWKPEGLVETNRSLLCYYLSATVLEWRNRTWVCPHTVQNEEMVPYAHPAVIISLFCHNEAAQILAHQPWMMASMGWCALTVWENRHDFKA